MKAVYGIVSVVLMIATVGGTGCGKKEPPAPAPVAVSKDKPAPPVQPQPKDPIVGSDPSTAQPSAATPIALAGEVKPAASQCYAEDTVAALNDDKLPKSSADASIPRMTWWDHKGGTEWVSYEFPQPRKINSFAIYWVDDGGAGGCRAPATWRLLWKDGTDWRPVKLKPGSDYRRDLDKFNSVSFEPVLTQELKLEVTLLPEFSGGILEWQVSGAP